MISLLENFFSAQWFLNLFLLTSASLFIFWIILKLFKSGSLPLRSNIALFAMLGILCLPFFLIFQSAIQIPVVEPMANTNITTSVEFIQTAPIPAQFNQLNAISIKIINLFGCIWLMGFIISLGYSIIGFLKNKQFNRHLTPLQDHRFESIEFQLMNLFNVSKLPSVYLCSKIKYPFTIGIFKPMIVIPTNLYQQITKIELQSILFHELAHILHRDNTILLLQKITQAANWYNPLIYKISKEFSEIREYICDRYALKFLKPRNYAESLLNLAEKAKFGVLTPFALNMALEKYELKSRIKRIISEEKSMKTKTSNIITILFFILTIFAVGFIANQKMVFAQSPSVDIATKSDVLKLDKQPKLIKKVKPKFPMEALRARIEGVVDINATTDIYGRVVDAKIVSSSHESLNEACLEAIKQWIYEPYLVDDKPTPVEFKVKFHFNLSNKEAKSVKNAIKLGQVSTPKLFKEVKPIFPPAAIRAGITGQVVAKVVTDTKGNVANVIIASSAHPLLNEACIKAIRQWKYKPYIVNGQPKAVEFVVRLNLNLSNYPKKKTKSVKNAIKLKGVKTPKLIKEVKPIFPPEALRAKITGQVVASAVTDTKGDVTDVKIVNSAHPLLDEACIKAIKQWKYKPYIVNGEPKSTEFVIRMNFKLSDEPDKKTKSVKSSIKLGQEQTPKLLKEVKPKYPPAALRARISGHVVAKVLTDTNGDVANIKIVSSSHPFLNSSSIKAIKQWKYEPYLVDGKPTPVDFTVKMNFNLPSKLAKSVKNAIKLGEAKTPKLIKEVKPYFPKKALDARVVGRIVLSATTDADGKVKSVKVITSAHPLLNKPCLDAVKQWIYEPYLIDGVPKPVSFVVRMQFNLSQK